MTGRDFEQIRSALLVVEGVEEGMVEVSEECTMWLRRASQSNLLS